MFILTDEPVLHRREWRNDAGELLALTFREMTDEEKEQFDLEFAEIQNRPGDKPEDYSRRYNEHMAKWGAKILVEWEGVVDKAKKPIPITDEAKAKFCRHKESRKYWRLYLFNYLWPKAEGEKRVDPPSSKDRSESTGTV